MPEQLDSGMEVVLHKRKVLLLASLPGECLCEVHFDCLTPKGPHLGPRSGPSSVAVQE